MNDDEFEKELRALGGAMHRSVPTPAWKADILRRAHREAKAIRPARTLPPRWLMLAWAAAWLAILGMDFTASQEPAFSVTREAEISNRKPTALTSPQGDPVTLLAFQQRLRLNLDLP